MKKMILRKCKSLSRQLGRSSSYSSLRSKSSTPDDFHYHNNNKEEAAPPPLPVHEHQVRVVIFVGSTRKRYVINSEYLDHPLLKSLIEKPDDDVMVVVKCEVVLFDHLLWMLDNNGANPDFISESSLEELANLYVF